MMTTMPLQRSAVTPFAKYALPFFVILLVRPQDYTLAFCRESALMQDKVSLSGGYFESCADDKGLVKMKTLSRGGKCREHAFHAWSPTPLDISGKAFRVRNE